MLESNGVHTDLSSSCLQLQLIGEAHQITALHTVPSGGVNYTWNTKGTQIPGK